MPTYQIDPAHSRVGFATRHMTVSVIRGHFREFKGTVTTADDDAASAQVQLTVQVASIDTGIEARDNHLRGDDYFAVEKYPELRFKSTGITPAGGGRFRVTGDLTIRDTTKPVTLEAELGGPIQDPFGNTRVGITLTGTISRKEWGLTANPTIESGGPVIADEVKLEVETEFTKVKEEASVS
ncbi:MAG: YceI family protein [Candidatus Dormibacteraeota bacterium]|nr:YceI family protein [Candidatus Dormibacteraeota bacterium]MBO0703945.1 YceI family protein [Candidatus Dormibacteraeota bacterium]MBO0761123.1 YceI family protein [Candidatus Dormibacteraeota bacterium]